MFEKVNPSHPDKLADRIAGAIVDLAYSKNYWAKCAVEVLLGHGDCTIIVETSEAFHYDEIQSIVNRIAGRLDLHLTVTQQDVILANNQADSIRCGDNGIFKGVPITVEQRELSDLARKLYHRYPSDGKYLSYNDEVIICQSNADEYDIKLRNYQTIYNINKQLG